MIKNICSLATDYGLAEIIAKNTDDTLNKGVSKIGSIATQMATIGAESAWTIAQIIETTHPDRKSQLPQGAKVTRPNANSRPRVGVCLMPY